MKKMMLGRSCLITWEYAELMQDRQVR